jgi:hypothetical protein
LRPDQTFGERCESPEERPESVITVIEVDPHADGEAEDDVEGVAAVAGQHLQESILNIYFN